MSGPNAGPTGPQLVELRQKLAPIMQTAKDILPPGTHYGFVILIPGHGVTVLSTDREKIAEGAAYWVASIVQERGASDARD